MKSSEILKKTAEIIEADTDFNNFCQTSFGKLPIVHVGPVSFSGLSANDYPFVIVSGISGFGEGVSPRNSWSVQVICGANSAVIETAGRRQIRKGAVFSEEMRSLATIALTRGGIGRVKTISGIKLSESVSHPLYVSGMKVKIEAINENNP